MSHKTAVPPDKKNAMPLVSGFFRHAAVRSVSEHYLPPVAHPESSFGHDFSRVPVRGDAPIMIQTKLITTGQSQDPYEREAERVADAVMSERWGQRQMEPQGKKAQVVQKKEVAEQVAGSAPANGVSPDNSPSSANLSMKEIAVMGVRGQSSPLQSR